ncbi:MAG: glutaredoxin domain-containing protein [Sulfurovum sp.]
MLLFSRVFLPFLLLSYISTETYLKLQHSSLCDAVGCKLAGELLKFDALYLNYMGIVGVSILIILGFLSRKIVIFEKLFFISLYSAIAFESVIISYQFFVNPELCVFCLGIFSSLLIIAIVSNIKNLFLILPIGAIIVALGILNIPTNEVLITSDGKYLIQSPICSHCKKVKKYFKENHIAYNAIESSNTNAKMMLKSMGINTIPILIIKEKSHINIIKGDRDIIAHFESTKEPDIKEVINTSIPNQSRVMDYTDTFSAVLDEGCTIEITKATPCADDNATE